ncbi:MAG TPA: L,D-transpeptidase family protein [Rhodanobacter sp.]
MRAQASATEITISKAKRSLLYRGDGISRSFRIALGSSPVGRKTRQGDRKTPEGDLSITHKNPHSQFHFSPAISYPNADDAKAGLDAYALSKREFDAITDEIGWT